MVVVRFSVLIAEEISQQDQEILQAIAANVPYAPCVVENTICVMTSDVAVAETQVAKTVGNSVKLVAKNSVLIVLKITSVRRRIENTH
jgi:hypothetical protein